MNVETTGKIGPKRVVLSRANTGEEDRPVVSVRRIRDSERNRIAQAAGYVAGQTHTAMMFGELLLRSAIVGAERMTDADDGTAVPFKTVSHPALGQIAAAEIYNALGEEDVSLITDAYAGKTNLAEEQAKNS